MYRFMAHNFQPRKFVGDKELHLPCYRKTKVHLFSDCDRLHHFANTHEYYGFHRVNGGWVYREWAPGAVQLYLAGEFNGWDWREHPMMPLGGGRWVLYLPGDDTLWEGCGVKTVVEADFQKMPHIPLYACRITSDPDCVPWCADRADGRKEYLWEVPKAIPQIAAESNVEREQMQA